MEIDGYGCIARTVSTVKVLWLGIFLTVKSCGKGDADEESEFWVLGWDSQLRTRGGNMALTSVPETSDGGLEKQV